MHLSDIIGKLNYRITSGSEYKWNCYPSAKLLDFESEYATISVVFNSDKQMVYEITTAPKNDKHRPYRWIDPDYIDFYIKESNYRGIDTKLAWDDVQYIDLETEEDILKKTEAIFNGENFDTRIEVAIELDDDTWLELAKQAHKHDITINKMVEKVLQHCIDNHTVNGFST